ncbi:MAG TPA: IS200/IS605 family transposase [Clostridia bacterium]|nr:IS200/IS605 family transposase [Clostridia bacterium]
MGQEYKRTSTTVSLINYHFVFCPRYRRKVLIGEVETRFKELLYEISEEMGIDILAIECDKDYCHLFVNVLPTLSPADIMAKVKGVTSRKLRQEFQYLHHLPSLWTRSYYVSTAGNVSSETIKRYVNEQKMRG